MKELLELLQLLEEQKITISSLSRTDCGYLLNGNVSFMEVEAILKKNGYVTYSYSDERFARPNGHNIYVWNQA